MSPLFSLITPVYDPPLDVLDDTIASVVAQSNNDWEWIVVDDGSGPAVRATLRAAARADHRIRVIERSTNGGIVAASNDALDEAGGAFVVLLDHDDVIRPMCLQLLASAIAATPDVDYLYSDEVLRHADNSPPVGFYKPDWSPERLRSVNYCSHVSVFRRTLVMAVGGFRDGFDGAQDHDLVLRSTELARAIVHVPYALYEWRQVEGSVAADRTAKMYAYEAGQRAVADQLVRLGIEGTVDHAARLGTYRVVRSVPDVLTSVIVPTAGATGRVWGVERIHAVEALLSVASHTSRRIEFVVVADSDTPDVALDAIRRATGDTALRIVEYDREFNFSEKVNLGAVHASGEVLLLLNDDVEVISSEFLDPLVPLALEPGVGAVGCLLLFADGRVQHAGHVYTGSTRHIFYGRNRTDEVPGDLLSIQRECVGVTAACMAVSAEVFARVGGFTPALSSNYNDVDFCLKLRSLGYRNVWTPYAELYHFESVTRDPTASVAEWDEIVRRWGDQVATDPYSNPNLEPQRDDWVERGLR